MNLKTRLAIGAVLVIAVVLAVAAVAERHATAQQQSDPALEEFIPSEKLPADSSISFPVDI
jgi:hypothetical protein